MTRYYLTLCNKDTGEILAYEEYEDELDPNEFDIHIVLKPGLIE